MPLVHHNNLPTFDRLRAEGQFILPKGRAIHQDIRELHIGVLNLMPDAALEATERQFMRLIGDSIQVAQIYVHFFTIDGVERSLDTQAYIGTHYKSFNQIKAMGLDALIISGTSEDDPVLKYAPYYNALQKVIDWAWDYVPSTLFACLATHALMSMRYNQTRRLQDQKLWGVYDHRVLKRKHPLVINMNTSFHAPHSRLNAIDAHQFEAAGMDILVRSAEAGVHVATTPDGFRFICFQGHPEYDMISLFKEYKREVANFIDGARADYPPFVENYFGPKAQAILNSHKNTILQGERPDFPEEDIVPLLENSWKDSARAIISNWIGLVYQTTHMDRTKLFMDDIDPDNPIGIL